MSDAINAAIANIHVGNPVAAYERGRRGALQAKYEGLQRQEFERKIALRSDLEALARDPNLWSEFQEKYPIEAAEMEAKKEKEEEAQLKQERELWTTTTEAMHEIGSNALGYHDELIKQGVPEEEARARTNELFQQKRREFAEGMQIELPEDELDLDELRFEVGVLDKSNDKTAAMKELARIGELEDKAKSVPLTSQEQSELTGLKAKYTKKDDAPFVGAPTKAEREDIDGLIDNNEAFKELSSDDKKVAKAQTASRARELMKIKKLSWFDASREAVEEARSGVVDTGKKGWEWTSPSTWFDGANAEYNPDLAGQGSTDEPEIIERNGKKYQVVGHDEDGEPLVVPWNQ